MPNTNLASALLGYAPVIDEAKNIAGFRLRCVASAGHAPLELGRIYQQLVPHLKPESPGHFACLW